MYRATLASEVLKEAFWLRDVHEHAVAFLEQNPGRDVIMWHQGRAVALFCSNAEGQVTVTQLGNGAALAV